MSTTFPGFSKALEQYKVVELKQFLRTRNLKVSGLKKQLVQRLRNALEYEYDDTEDDDIVYDDDDDDDDDEDDDIFDDDHGYINNNMVYNDKVNPNNNNFNNQNTNNIHQLILLKKYNICNNNVNIHSNNMVHSNYNVSHSNNYYIHNKYIDNNNVYNNTVYNNRNIFDRGSPKSILSQSHFLRQYDEFNKNKTKITNQTIRECLPYNLKQKLDVEMKGVTNTEKICVWLWSLGSTSSGLYKSMNMALYSDEPREIKRYLPIIRGLNYYLVHKTKKSITTWRGSKMSRTHFKQYKENKIFRCPAIGATSLDYNEAKKFRDKYMIKFRIPRGCWNAAEISTYSKYKKEKEVVFPPYTAFKVLQIHYKHYLIEVEILDNKYAPINAPSVFI